MKKRKIVFTSSMLLATMLIFSSYSGGMSTEFFTGSPGSNGKCTNCHSNLADLGATLNVVVVEKGKTTPVTTYSLGKTYTVGIAITGGKATARGTNSNIVNKADGNNAGTLTNVAGGKIISVNTREAFTHSPANITGIYSYDWTPSGNIDSVQIFTTAIAGNGNGNKGDQFLENVTTLSKEQSGSASTVAKNKINFYPNPVLNALYFDKKVDFVKLYSQSGALVQEWSAVQKMDLTTIAAGKYYMHYGSATEFNTAAVIKL